MNGAIARRFAQFATADFQCPQSVLGAADRAILDTLGAMIVGGVHPSVQAMADAFPCPPGPATLATGGSAPADFAALVNGMAAHVWDIDDTSYTGIMHGSAVILPAVLAVAQETGARSDLIQRAFIVGSEIAYCLAEACTHDHYFQGWWSTATFGLIGASAAVSVVLQLDEDQTVAAIGTAAAASGGGKTVIGTDSKPFLAGDAARRAVGFARIARAGLSGPEHAFEDDRGFLKLLNNAEVDLTALETLAVRWRLVTPGLFFKTHPVCSAAHAAIDQLNALLSELTASADQIIKIEAEVPELVFISLAYADPQTPQQAQFSLPFALACAALYGRVRFEDLRQNAIRAPDKLALMQKVHVQRAADLSTQEMRANYPESARLTVTLKDGRTARGFCGIPLGMPEKPLSDRDLICKFETATSFAGHYGFNRPRLGQDPVEIFTRVTSIQNQQAS